MAKKRDHEPKRGTTETAADGRTSDKGAGTAASTASRRKLIQALAASGVVVSAKLIPEKWGKPVVDSVALPAHAQTTEPTESDRCTLGINVPDIVLSEPASVYDGIADSTRDALDVLVETAWAGDAQDDEPEDTSVFCGQFTGCFWIRFECNSREGRLFARVFDFGDDSGSDEDAAPDCEEISAPFMSGVESDIGGAAFTVTIISRNEATLQIDCFSELTLVPNFDCGPCPDRTADT